MLHHLRGLRAQLLGEIRAADDATDARVDELLRVDKLPTGHEDRPDDRQP